MNTNPVAHSTSEVAPQRSSGRINRANASADEGALPMHSPACQAGASNQRGPRLSPDIIRPSSVGGARDGDRSVSKSRCLSGEWRNTQSSRVVDSVVSVQ
jgi:hypothetical protein